MTDTSKKAALCKVGIITLLFCLIYGLPNFLILPKYLPQSMSVQLKACWMIGGFALSAFLLLVIILQLYRRDNIALRAIGWRKPTNILSVIIGVVFAFAWLGLGYMNNQRFSIEFPLIRVDIFRIYAALLAVFAGGFVEEIVMRGVVLKELYDAGTKTWFQILISGFCFGIYHSIHFITNPMMFIPGLMFSMFMGCILAWIYILGNRSLTPCIICHGLLNLLGEPYLLMGAIAAQNQFG